MTANILNLPERNVVVQNIYFPKLGKSLKLPLFLVPVSAGFPSPADDYSEKSFDFNALFLNTSEACFVVEVSGDSMINAGIYSGDSLVIDRSLTPQDGDVVVACIDGEFTLKTFSKIKGRVYLEPANSNYSRIEITETMDAAIWGVVSSVHRKMRR